MLTWQKRARLLVLAVAIGVVAVVFATTRKREEPPPPEPATRIDPAAVVESSGAFVVQVKGERETVRIDAEKQLSYSDGSSRLLNVKVTSVRQGKTFVATGDEARVGENQTHLDMKGHVHMVASDGLDVTAESATYSQSEGIVRAPGPVTFKRGRMSGSGVDFSYDEPRDLIGLSDQTRVQIAPDKRGGDATDITAGSAVLAREDKFVSFQRDVRIVRGGQVVTADGALGLLTENEEHLSGLELQGNARIETPKAAPGDLKLMSGEVVNLTYYEGSDLVQSAVISGNGSLRIAAEGNAPESVLHAQNIEIGMAPDGTTVTSLNGRDQVVLDLPAAAGGLTKKVTSTSLVASGTAATGLTAATFSEGVEYEEAGGDPPVKRTVTSRSLETTLNRGIGDIRDATFLGSPRLREGDTGANASKMRYEMKTGQVTLTGAAGDPVPRVVNEQLHVDASQIDMSIEGSKLKATGGTRPVQSLMVPAKAGAKNARRTPGLMKQDEPVMGISRELVYTGGEKSNIEFTGGVKLWQGEKLDTVIQGEKVSIDDATGNLRAEGSVLATIVLQDTNPTKDVKETTRSTGQGQQMVYDDTLRTITYTTKARLIGPQGDLTGDTVVLTLGANGQDVERLEGTGNVRLEEADRVTTGDHMTYVAATEEYNMSGKGRLVRMLRTLPEGCRKSEGSLLTFSRATDTLRIEGREETRTSTSSDSSCVPPKR
jgi:LPS export ABC transporter protein LptC